MKISKRRLRKIVKEERARLVAEQSTPAERGMSAARQEVTATGHYGRTSSGDPQSYRELANGIGVVSHMLENLSMDYSDSGWLDDGDHTSLRRDLDKAWQEVDRLRSTFESLADSMGE